MTAAPRPRRWLGVLLVWGGTLMIVVGGALGVAWWKLPTWQRDWVIEYSPFTGPVLRAMLGDEHDQGHYHGARVVDHAPAIGSRLRAAFVTGSTNQRSKVLSVALASLRDAEDIADHRDAAQVFSERMDGTRLSYPQALAFRRDIEWLIDQACADGHHDLREATVLLIAAIPDPRWVPVLCRWAVETRDDWMVSEIMGALARSRDPVAVPHLIPLLATAKHPGRVAYALNRCLVREQSHLVLAAANDAHPRLRAWAAEVLLRFADDPAMRQRFAGLARDPVVEVRLAVFEALNERALPADWHHLVRDLLDDPSERIRRYVARALIDHGCPEALRPAFLHRLSDPSPGVRALVVDALATLRWSGAAAMLADHLQHETETFLRLNILEALEGLRHPGLADLLRRISAMPDDPARGAAIIALGRQRDVADLPRLQRLLLDVDEGIARKAYLALTAGMPLTREQSRHIAQQWLMRQHLLDPADDDPAVKEAASPPAP